MKMLINALPGRVAALIGCLALVFGLSALVAPAANADTTVTVESVSYSDSSASASVVKEANAVIDGATQLLWWYPNHNIKVSKSAVAKAPHIKVRYQKCSLQSQGIAKQARGKSIVVAMPGSVICNTGMNGRIIGGFKWTVKRPAVLKWNARLRLYQHVYDITGSTRDVSKMRLIKTCGNRMGGKVHRMYPKVIQVRYASSLLIDVDISAKAEVKAKVEASLKCPTGTLYGYAEATGSATASARIRVKASMKATLTNAKKAELINKASVSAKANAEAAAKAKITLTCSDNPPEPETPKAVIEIDELNDVDLTDPECEGTRDECESYLISTVHATVPSGVSGTLRISSNIGTVGFTNGTPANPYDDVKTLDLGPGQHDPKYRFNAPTEGTSATITLTFTPSEGSGVAPEPVSTTVRLNEPPTPPL